MKKKIGIGLLALTLGVGGWAFAMTLDVEHGKVLFADPGLGGGD